MVDSMDKIVSLCKRRGFIFPGSEIYGGLANSWDYGPLGTELKNNIKQLWWKKFVQERDDIVGIDAALIMNPKVWEASGHLKNFQDYLIECKTDKCNTRVRIDDYLPKEEISRVVQEINDATKLIDDGKQEESFKKIDEVHSYVQNYFNKNIDCPKCGNRNWSRPAQFNLMLRTFLGATLNPTLENLYYFRPETAQAMFVDFKNVVDTTRKTLPFGIAQIGKAFRNEITPGNFIFRTREFEQMEIEYFIPVPQTDEDWQKHFEYWKDEMMKWIKGIGLDLGKIHGAEIPDGERAHYSKRTIDFEYEFPFGKSELYGLAYRTDFDLKNHFKEPPYKDQETGVGFYPHVIEPTWGVDRTVLAVLVQGYEEDGERAVLKLKPALAPYKVAVFPLLANKPDLVKLARGIYLDLKKNFMVAFDDRGNIGKRYYSQDEIGTPWCVTVDFDSLEDQTVTVRDRDTAKQERIKINELKQHFTNGLQKDSS